MKKYMYEKILNTYWTMKNLIFDIQRDVSFRYSPILYTLNKLKSAVYTRVKSCI